ncbi:hypothetical protein BD560DRAFT_401315 [Blakeslea trispora]|nr:hypothetical protein BD560DRAFT_401315 [Blakeslea trispora]
MFHRIWLWSCELCSGLDRLVSAGNLFQAYPRKQRKRYFRSQNLNFEKGITYKPLSSQNLLVEQLKRMETKYEPTKYRAKANYLLTVRPLFSSFPLHLQNI